MPQAQREIAHIQATAQYNNEQTDQRFQRLEQEFQRFRKTLNEHTASLQSLRDELSDQKVKMGNQEQEFKTLTGYVARIRKRELISEFGPNIFEMEEAEKATAEGSEGKKEEEEKHAV